MSLAKLFTCARILQRRQKYDWNIIRSCCAEPQLPKSDECDGGDQKLDSNMKGLVLGVYESKKQFCLTPAAEEVDQKSGGKICQYLNQLSGEMKLGRAFVVTDLLPEYPTVALSSLGPKDSAYCEMESLDEARENTRWMVGAGVRVLMSRGCGTVQVDPAAAPDAAAEAAELAAWRFEIFKAPGDRKPDCHVTPYDNADEKLWQQGSIRGRAQNWARYLSDMPANRMTPIDVAQAAIEVLCPLGVEVAAHDREWIVAQRMRAFLAVARGACSEPLLLEATYRGAGRDTPPVLIAAKGVTFDSGGLCLKECSTMEENRGSMAGAAVALAAVKALALLKVPINVTVVVPLCENMVSGQCMKVGDIVKALNGLTIQIENTDYEGRLMMADALVYGQTMHRPSLVIDVATFTRMYHVLCNVKHVSRTDPQGSCLADPFWTHAEQLNSEGGVLMATGGGAFGCFSNCERAWRALRRAGASAGDRPWRFPLWHYYQKQITNDPSVDLRNKGSGHATPCLGAAFLRNFICGDWVHMDITGVGKVAHFGAPPYLDPRRMTGRPCRTLAMLLASIASDSQADVCGRNDKSAYGATS